jgi:hypothetical protein
MDVLIEMGAIKPLYRRPPAEEEDFPAFDEV